jgi:hypothetical protein
MVDVEPGLPPVAVPVPAFVPASRPPQPKAATMATAGIQGEIEFIESTRSKNKTYRNTARSGQELGSTCATEGGAIIPLGSFSGASLSNTGRATARAIELSTCLKSAVERAVMSHVRILLPRGWVLVRNQGPSSIEWLGG